MMNDCRGIHLWNIQQLARSNRVCLAVAIGFLVVGTLGCNWMPRAQLYVVPTPLPELAFEILEMPERVCIGDVAIFIVETKPGNECSGGVRYRSAKNSWDEETFEPIVSSEQGFCRWTWRVDDSAMAGDARFIVNVRGYGDVESSSPQPFDIEDCGE